MSSVSSLGFLEHGLVRERLNNATRKVANECWWKVELF